MITDAFSSFSKNSLRLFVFFLLVSFTISTTSCGKKTEPEVIAPEPEGVFSDVLKAIYEIGDEYPKEISEEDGITKKERKLLLEGRSSFFVPVDTYEYYYDYEEEGEGINPLDTILNSEWEEYLALSSSLSSEDTSSRDTELRGKIEENLKDFYLDLPELMAETDLLPEHIRRKVISIVSLRYHNTILRGGLDPVSFFEGSK
jgi:hypothetical protein